MNRDRKVEPMTINDKYIEETIERTRNENIYRITRGVYDPNILKYFSCRQVAVKVLCSQKNHRRSWYENCKL